MLVAIIVVFVVAAIFVVAGVIVVAGVVVVFVGFLLLFLAVRPPYFGALALTASFAARDSHTCMGLSLLRGDLKMRPRIGELEWPVSRDVNL